MNEKLETSSGLDEAALASRLRIAELASTDESGAINHSWLAAAARIASPKATEEEKLQLALDHQLLTDQTNCLIVAERAEKAEDLPELAKVAHILPAGWGGTQWSCGDRAIVSTVSSRWAC